MDDPGLIRVLRTNFPEGSLRGNASRVFHDFRQGMHLAVQTGVFNAHGNGARPRSPEKKTSKRV